MDAEEGARGFCPFEGDDDNNYSYKLKGEGENDDQCWEAEGEGSVSFYQSFAGVGDDDASDEDGGKSFGLLAAPEEEEEEEEEYSPPAPMALADMMLRNLGKEYNSTVEQGGVLPKPISPKPVSASAPPQAHADNVVDDDGFGAFAPPVPPSNSRSSSSSSSSSSSLPSFATATFDPFPTTTTTTTTTTSNAPSSGKPAPSIDIAAVKRAVLAIRQSAPQLALNLDRGACVLPPGGSSPTFLCPSPDLSDDALYQKALAAIASGERGPSSSTSSGGVGSTRPTAKHPVIPLAPLRAFLDGTAVSIKSSRNLSRSCTIGNALHLFGTLDVVPGSAEWNASFFPPGVDPKKNPELSSLVIHVVGSDSVECETLSAASMHFSPLVRWLSSYFCLAVASSSSSSSVSTVLVPTIDVVLIGPGVPSRLSGQRHVLPPHTSLPLSRGGSVSCETSLYHEYLSSLTSSSSSWPALSVAFNAGIWGYDSWQPTLHYLAAGGAAKGGVGRALHFVVTSYTSEEGKDDQESIEAIVKEWGKDGRKTRAACIWGSEDNEFGSRAVRETKGAVEGRIYRENAAWQGWRFEIL